MACYRRSITAVAKQADKLEAERRSKVALHSYRGTPGTTIAHTQGHETKIFLRDKLTPRSPTPQLLLLIFNGTGYHSITSPTVGVTASVAAGTCLDYPILHHRSWLVSMADIVLLLL